MGLRNKRVVIYGGAELDPPLANFVSRLAYALLKNESILLVTGGFKGKSDDRSGPVSTDVSVRDGARDFALQSGEPLESCLETCLPEPVKDRHDVDPDRFHDGNVQTFAGFSAQARRLKLVQIADAVLTVRGYVQTALVLEMALATTRAAVPLPFTNGDSATHWQENRAHYLARLSINEEQATRWESIRLDNTTPDSTVTKLINEVVAVVNRVIGRKCLLLMPFSDDDSTLTGIIRDVGFQDIRLDRDLHTGDVRQTVQQLVQDCDAVVADITKLSANVMYEVGLAHAQGKKPPPLLIWRADPDLLETSLPFYLRPHRIASSKDRGGTLGALRDYLEAIRNGSSSTS
jgi:hypothetical protein